MYESIRAQLEETRARLEARLNKIATGHLGDKGPVNADFEEQATETANDEVYEGLDANGRAQITQIDAALERMKTGTYGVCIECEDDIPVARLQALPFALRCIECETAHSR
jgi:RNA polymerase-binding protein DksA